jgi:antitoxin ParD1/3/4
MLFWRRAPNDRTIGQPRAATHASEAETASPAEIRSMSPRDMNMNVSLPEEQANFVKDKVSTGRYGSSSEVVLEALRLMERTEQQEAEKLALLRRAWREGIDSDGTCEIDFAALKQEARARLAASKRGA